MKMPPKSNHYSDNFYTPEIAIKPLLEYINKDWKIWECCSGTGNIVKYFKDNGFNIFGTDLDTGDDFLQSNKNDFDCIITNPPFSLKDKFLDKCFSYQKPFAMLLPLTALEGQFRQSLYRKNNIKIILFNKRINYQGHKNKNSCWFASIWITYKIPLLKQLTFVEL